MSQPPGDPVGRRDARPDRPLGGERGTHDVEDLERETHPVLEASAVGVGALVGDRREELVQQVAVRRMDLDAVDAEARGALRRGREVGADLLHAGGVERVRRLLAGRMRHGRRRDRGPAAGLVVRHLRAALPRRAARGLAAGVRELHADRDRRVRAHAARTRASAASFASL